MSTTVTSLPRSARQAAVVKPTYPAPMTATLLTAGRLCQQGFVYRDCLPGRAVPTELPRPLQSCPAPPLALAGQRERCVAKRYRISICDHHPGITDHFRNARVAEGRDRAPAGH